MIVIVGTVLVLAGLLIGSAIVNGGALSVMWLWFIVPTFDLPALSILQAIGISMVVSMLTDPGLKGAKMETGEALSRIFARPLFAVLIGWVVKSLM